MDKLTHKQQLALIEGLTLLWENSKKTIGQADKLIGEIYKITHLNGTCENEHLDWHEEGHKLGKELKEMTITNYNK